MPKPMGNMESQRTGNTQGNKMENTQQSLGSASAVGISGIPMTPMGAGAMNVDSRAMKYITENLADHKNKLEQLLDMLDEKVDQNTMN